MDGIIEIINLGWHFLLMNTFYLNIILSVVIIFFQRRDPKSVWAWLLLLYFVPVLGFILYLVIGQNFHKNKMFRVKEVEDQLNKHIKKQEKNIEDEKFEISDGRVSEYYDQVWYNLVSTESIYTENNKMKIFTSGDDIFSEMLMDLKSAKKFIHIQYYILRSGELLNKIIEVLEEKVKEGVIVRLHYDSEGCNNKLKKKDLRRMKKAGIMVGEFFPAFLGRFQLRFNYRNHRKLVIIDSEKAYFGGFNVGDEYIDKDKKYGHWRDTHFKVEGEAVNDLNLRFMLDWNYTAKESLFGEAMYFKNDFANIEDKLGMQIVSSGPDSKRQGIKDNYIKLINKAKNRIYIQTPYFIPDEAVAEALKIAALSGVDVRIMIPCKPDHPFVYWCTYSYAGDLLDAGARVFCYNAGFLHAKGMIADGIVSCYGTANMDMRSFGLNFEVNAVIYDPEVSEELEKIFINDLENCSEVTKEDYDKRKFSIRVKEQVARLIAPIL